MSLRTMHEEIKKNKQELSEPIQLHNMDEMLSMIQKLSSDNRQLISTVQTLSRANSQKNEELQELLSMEQTLKSRIVQQAEQIERLNESDLELRKAEELQNSLKEKEKNWQNELKKYQEEVSHANRQAQNAIQKAKSEQNQAEKKKAEYDRLIADEKKKIELKADELNDQFRQKWQFWFAVVAIYGAIATVFTGICSERVKNDCTNACEFIMNVFLWLVNSIESISEQITESVDIPLPVVTIVITVVVFGIVGLLLYFGGKFIFKLYQEYCFDESGLFITLVIVAILVWFADSMPLNIVLMFIISQLLYIDVRWYVKGYRKNHS